MTSGRWFRNRRTRKPRPLAIAASVVLHGGLLGGIWFAGMSRAQSPADFRVYRVNIVSPPPQSSGEPQPATVAAATTPPPQPTVEPATPEPAQPVPAKPVEAPPVNPPEKKPEPKPVAPKPAEKPPTASPVAKAETPKPEPAKPAATKPPPKTPAKAGAGTPSTGNKADPKSAGGEGLNVQIRGEEFPDPDYLANIVLQLNRYFRWQGADGLKACVYFVINRDGSVRDIQVTHPSGNLAFDLRASGAVEVAGNRNAFGPLPKAWTPATLPISFGFYPSGLDDCG